jgi:integrase
MLTVHHVRPTVASLLKDLSLPARDAQIILGHSRLAVTLEIYTHADASSGSPAFQGSGACLPAPQHRLPPV